MSFISRQILRVAGAIVFGMVLSLYSDSANSQTLTVSDTENGRELILSDLDLQTLPQASITTNTPWTDEPTTFEGPTLWALIESVEALGRDLELVALNDYSVTIDTDRITEGWPIVARLVNGQTMSVREKGPYWLIFPFDQDERLQAETYYALSIWQLATINVMPSE